MRFISIINFNYFAISKIELNWEPNVSFDIVFRILYSLLLKLFTFLSNFALTPGFLIEV